MFVVDTDDPEIMMYLGQDEPLPGTPEFGERARRRIAIIKGTRIPETKGPDFIDYGVKAIGEQAEQMMRELQGPITKILLTGAIVVGAFVLLPYLLPRRR